ncbi:PIN domain-containing protein [Gluconobacter kondonii]|uniref:PIN domain-containing protein n=1 Tax=Gluconobacter kondonii TaxID=941463 RepID=A0ABQ5WV10_9PROT|nr:PIN domain-containing protein [Gluconobacter kondonii]GBR41818.1 hypothetical protein AA3266_2871 [Gluconobacter kondonii NBRC 3266]GLQ67362.1 hypothetical protein GCM10007870_29470 [Gluconobacter kondonii]
MSGTLQLVVDTNLFHECKSLDAADFPWSDLGSFNAIELIVSDTVQSELDRQKKDTRQRVRRRAVQAVSWFREMLKTGAQEHLFRAQGPRVVMRVSPQTASQEHPDLLDLSVDDDKIVGVAVALAKAAPGQDVRLLSHDTRPISKANAVGLPFLFVPDTWMREPETDDAEREIRQLKEEIAELRKTHPALELGVVSAVDRKLNLMRDALAPLTEDEARGMLNRVSQRFSLSAVETAFARTAAARRNDSFGMRGSLVRIQPPPEQIKRYREETYPAWIAACVGHLGGLAALMNVRLAAPPISVTLSNIGYRPAENVVIRFTARGPFLIAPPNEGGYAPELDDLPRVPSPPTERLMRDGQEIAYATHVRSVFDSGLPDLGRYLPRSTDRSDEDWYYEPDRPKEPVDSFDLECRRFRHGANPEYFDVLIFPQTQDAVARGVLEVEVSASNVGRKITATFPVTVVTTFKSPVSFLDEILARQDLFRDERDARRSPF